MSKRIAVIIGALCALGFGGCGGRTDQMGALCGELEAAACLTDDCGKMAKRLGPISERFMRNLAQKSEAMSLQGADVPPSEEDMAYLEAVSCCMKSFMEIRVGTCGRDPAVTAVLPKPQD